MKIQGYGVQKTACEWAALLGMDPADLFYYLGKKGLTIEDLYRIRGKKPPKTERKSRFTEQMRTTRQRIGILLEMSGYIDRNDLEEIEVKRVGTHTDHAVKFKGKALGVYNYKTGALSLSSGEGFPLWKLEWKDAKIQQTEDGLWEIHPDTKTLLLTSIIPSVEDDDQLLRGIYETKQREKDTKTETYEGFGKRHTCAEWARILRVPQTTLWRHLRKGRTVEDFAAEKGIKRK